MGKKTKSKKKNSPGRGDARAAYPSSFSSTKTPLPPRHRIFLNEYLSNNFNATKAYKAAFPQTTYETQRTEGAKLLATPRIKRRVEEAIRKKERVLEMKMIEDGLTKERWLAEVKRCAFTSLDDLLVVKKDPVFGTTINIHPTAKRDGKFGAAIKKISQTKFGVSIELHSKISALEQIGRACGWVRDIKELVGKDGKPIETHNTGPQVVVMLPAKDGPAVEGDDTEEEDFR